MGIVQKYIWIALLLLVNKVSYSQDVHFSQYSSSPSLVNPGAIGVFDGTARLVLNYRNQWTTLNSNYQTTAVAFESVVVKKKTGSNFLGVGANVISDKAGIGALKRLALNLGAAYHVYVNRDHNIGLGLQVGFEQRSLDLSKLTWDSQYNGTLYDETRSSGENFQSNTSYLDFGAGLHWGYSISSTRDINTGVGIFHVNQPTPSFNKKIQESGTLPMKIVAQGLGRFTTVGRDIAYYPNFLVAFQGRAKEITAGMTLRYMVRESSKYTGMIKGNAIYFGGDIRIGDAIIFLLGLELADWRLGISYDINVSGFSSATGGVGGIEISLVWIKSD